MNFFWSCCLGFLFGVSAFAQGEEKREPIDARGIIQKMNEHMRGTTAYMEFTMKVVRPRYTREIGLKTWAKGEDFHLIYVTSPRRDEGTAYLKRGNEVWSWLPTIERLMKLPPSMMGQSWMGSDFTNDQLVRESSIVEDYDHQILREEKVGERNCYVIEMTPHEGVAVIWGRVIVWVDKTLFVQMKGEHYDERNRLINTVSFSEIKSLGGREIPTKVELTPKDKPDQKTILIYENARFEIELEPSFFSIQNLRSVR